MKVRDSRDISIYDYLDYRRFLRDAFEEKKNTLQGFSYRTFSRSAGIVSPSFLKLVMDGKRNLTPSSIRKFARGFRLKPDEAEYFENLVLYNQAADEEEGEHYFAKLSREREVATLTVAITKEKLELAKTRIEEFRQELSGLLSDCEEPDSVYQFNFHLSEVGLAEAD